MQMESISEITSEDYYNGCFDLQGINWENNLIYNQNISTRLTKSIYRQIRNSKYMNYQDLQWNKEKIKKEITPVRDDGKFFKFRHSKFGTNSSICHFQLRNLLASPTKNDIYYYAKDSIRHWSPITHESKPVYRLDINTHINTLYSLTASRNLIACGIGSGTYVVCNTNSPKNYKVNEIPRISQTDPQASTIDYTINYMKFIDNHTRNLELLIASNDYYCRMVDINTFKYTYNYRDINPINCASLKNDGKTLLVVGDSTKAKLLDITSNRIIHQINDHYDFLFSCEWSPNGNYFATGGQDMCVRIYDNRNIKQSLNVLPMNIASVRSMRFTDDNQYLAVAEQIDYVHIYDAANGLFLREQVIDFFADIAGISFTPGEGQGFYISTVDSEINSHQPIIPTILNNGVLMEFERYRYSRSESSWIF
ncbi:WD40 repeat-like protein [Piromyces finnis]|uniref:WD40 repeat-like protein n=1 Tax=Piromyces finnis TaxID=1754191 RepID=A0A1Y1VL65_9FUNG|nr:WD40 repeat-like protein [Piromyces finnis]|eukprot:ORX59162.1 WD40 repeat-like protein [Piromyces finnis]